MRVVSRIQKSNIFTTLALFVTVLAGGLLVSSQTHAAMSQVGAPQITINPGGGVLSDGTDGLRFAINSDPGSTVAGQDNAIFRNTTQYCCTAGGPQLNIGGELYGQSGPAYAPNTPPWSSITILSMTGSTAAGSLTSDTGSGSATVRYTIDRNGLTYTMDRTVSYIYPNDFVTDSYTFTIPDGNTEMVKFYLGGDTAPGSSDTGYGVVFTQPVRSIISLNPNSQILFGFREMADSKPFDGAVSEHYYNGYPKVKAGDDIGFIENNSNHDAGLLMQWTLGSTPGVQTYSLQQFVNSQATNLTATFREETAQTGGAVLLDISAGNTLLTTVSGLGYTITLPSGLTIAPGAQSNACGGTLTASVGGNTVTLSGGTVGQATNCLVSVPVTSATVGTYALSAVLAGSLSNLTNNIGVSSVTFTDGNVPVNPVAPVDPNAPNAGVGSMVTGVVAIGIFIVLAATTVRQIVRTRYNS